MASRELEDRSLFLSSLYISDEGKGRTNPDLFMPRVLWYNEGEELV